MADISVNLEEAGELVETVLKGGLVPYIEGSPGLGKSDLVKQIAAKYKLKLIDIRLSQCDPTDLNGFGRIKGDIAQYVPFDIFPLENTPVPEGYNGWLVFIDEASAAPLSVQAAAYRLLLDREVGQHKLHSKVALIGAGNGATDKAIVNRMSTATQSRLIHLVVRADAKVWRKWADKNDIDHRIKAWIDFKEDALHKFDPNHNEKTFPAPRTWYFLSKLLKHLPEYPDKKVFLPLASGTVGQGMATEFFTFMQIYRNLPTAAQIEQSPATLQVPQELSTQFAITNLIGAKMKPATVDRYMIYLKRLPITFQTMAIKSAVARDPLIFETKEVGDWISKNAEEML